jgi:hypothetical protein
MELRSTALAYSVVARDKDVDLEKKAHQRQILDEQVRLKQLKAMEEKEEACKVPILRSW